MDFFLSALIFMSTAPSGINVNQVFKKWDFVNYIYVPDEQC